MKLFLIYKLHKMRILCILLFICMFNISQTLRAQLSVTSGVFTPDQLVKNIFLGDGVEVVNVKYTGADQAIGYFTNGKTNIGVEKGIVMCSGKANLAGQPNTGGSDGAANNLNNTDPDLDKITTNVIRDLCLLEIDFIPLSDSIQFNYVFASEEYEEWVCTVFNDVFGFFISGPGINGTFSNSGVNIALVPGTSTPVAINNVNNGNPGNAGCPKSNPQYFMANANGNVPTYDGMTKVLTAYAKVVPCQVYKIRLAISDASDYVYDSAVFLEAKSFGTPTIDVVTATASVDGAISEGCTTAKVRFVAPRPLAADLNIDVKLIGTATNLIDYTGIPTSVTIPKGDSIIEFDISGIADLLTEGDEMIGFDIQRNVCGRDTVWLIIRDPKLLKPNLGPDTTKCINANLMIDGTVPVPIPPPPTFTYNIPKVIPSLLDVNDPLKPLYVPLNVIGVLPGQLGPGVIRNICMDISHKWVDDMDVFIISPSGQILELTTDNGRDGDNYTQTCFDPLAIQPINYNDPFGAPKIYAPFTGNFQPEGSWDYLWDGAVSKTNGTWQLLLIDDAPLPEGTLNSWSISFNPDYDVNYDWSQNPSGLSCVDCPNPILDISAEGTYILKVTDSYGCEAKDTINISKVPAPAAPDVICGGAFAGGLAFNWTDVAYAKGYEVSTNGITWNPPNNGTYSHTINGLLLGQTATLYVKSLSDCGGGIDTLLCAMPPCTFNDPIITDIGDALCSGSATGFVDVDVPGAPDTITYQLGAKTNINGFFNSLTAGSYVVTVTDKNNCSDTISFTIKEPAVLKLNQMLSDSVKCFGDTTGKAWGIVVGGTPGYTFVWSNNSTDSVAKNLKFGAYKLTVTDANFCFAVGNVNVYEPAALTATSGSIPVKCPGSKNGKAFVKPSQGTAPYMYQWDATAGNQVQDTAFNLAGGVYSVTITDFNGCTLVKSQSVQEDPPMSVPLTKVNPSCSGKPDGSITANPSGGTPGYTYKWNDPLAQITKTASGLLPGSFTVTVTDAKGCTQTATEVLVAPANINIQSATLPTKCANTKDGKVTITVAGGIGPYSFKWADSPLTDSVRIDMMAGYFSVTVTDKAGCAESLSDTVYSPKAIVLQVTVDSVNCNGASDGEATGSSTGGGGGFTYKWSNGKMGSFATGFGIGQHMVTVTDAIGCSMMDTFEVFQPEAVSIQLFGINAKCNGAFSGEANANANGGVMPYKYAWDDPGSTKMPSLPGIKAGTYTVTVTDFNGCTQKKSVTITEPGPIDNTLVAESVSCAGKTDGQATSIPSGGVGNFTFKWSDPTGQTTMKAVNLAPNTYYVTITDGNGCKRIDTAIITAPVPIVLSPVGVNPLCNEGKGGTAFVTVNGGVAPFGFTWSNGAKQDSIKNVPASQYFVTVTDANGCSQETSVTLIAPNAINISAVPTDIQCSGDKNGMIDITATGGTGSFNFAWSNGTTNEDLTGVGAGFYTVTVTDGNGCTKLSSSGVNAVDPLIVSTKSSAVNCFGESNGTASVTISGGKPGYNVLWSNNAVSNTLAGLSAGVYYVTVTDQKNCALIDTAIVTGPSDSLYATYIVDSVRCADSDNGKIEFFPKGGNPPYSFSTDGIKYYQSTILIGLKAGTYYPIMTDKKGCKLALDSIIVPGPEPILVDLGPDFVLEYGKDTFLNAVITGGVAPLDYSWSLNDSLYLDCLPCLDPTVSGLDFAHLFSFKVTDANGCMSSDKILIQVKKTRLVWVPTAFSPNGDPNNPLVHVVGKSGTKVLVFRIYDRWGEKVHEARNFEINDVIGGWDGNFRNQPANSGVYVYYLEVLYPDGEFELLKGEITLIR